MSRRAPIPVTVIAGYLGAGKTTLLNHLLRHANGCRYAVLVNDFGAINIDADLIASEDDNAISLTNGCICCSIGGALYDAIDDLLKRKDSPDALIIEASGIAEPNRIADIARAEPELKHDLSLVLVDGEHFMDHWQNTLLKDSLLKQIKQADLIAISKSDVATADKIASVNDVLHNVNKDTQIIYTHHGQIDPNILSAAHRVDNVMESSVTYDRRTDLGHQHEDQYQRWHFQDQVAVERFSFDRHIQNLPSGILRLKGFVKISGGAETAYVQGVAGRISTVFNPSKKNELSRLVAIGLKNQFDPLQMDEWISQLLSDEAL